jgi:hypothetical protein
MSSTWLFLSGFPTHSLYAPLMSVIRAPCPRPPHYSWFDYPSNIWRRMQIMKPFLCRLFFSLFYLVFLNKYISYLIYH